MTEEMTAARSRLGPSPVRTRPTEAEELRLTPGTVLFQQWLLVRELGRGGFGAVFEARELNLDQIQAVKVLYPSMVTREESLRRFRREVRTMRSLSHAHIGRVFDYREDRDQDLALISMELVPGGTVRHLLEFAGGQGQDVPLALVWSIFEQTLEALAEAHRQKVMHRDVAPGNVLLSGGSPRDLMSASHPDPGVKLVDFGIAGLLDARQTLPGRGLGTVAYLAPEVLASGEVTPAADVYGVGAVVYELLTGEPPLGRFEVPSRLRPPVSKAFDRLLLDCLERHPDRRPSAAEALDRCRRLIRQPVGAARNGDRAREREDTETRTGSIPLVGNGGEPDGDEERWVSQVVLATSNGEPDPAAAGHGPLAELTGSRTAAVAAAVGLFLLALGLGALLRDLWVGGPAPGELVAETPDLAEVLDRRSDPPALETPAAEDEPAVPPASPPPPEAAAAGAPEDDSGPPSRVAGTNGHGDGGRPRDATHGRPAAPRPAVLAVESNPARAFVYLGGQFLGRAPLTTTVPLGRHEVMALSPGCQGERRPVTAGAGGAYHLAFALDCSYETTRVRAMVPPANGDSGFAWRPIAGPGTPLIEDRLEMRFIYLPSGEFLMGSPPGEAGRTEDETRHPVVLTRPFWIGETEVTQGQWRRLMGVNPSHFLACGDDCPVENVSWYEALEFANELSRVSGFTQCYEWSECGESAGPECREVRFLGLGCNGYRLPTEAEWEYAARAGTVGLFSGSKVDRLSWHRDNARACTHPAGKKAANPWGVRDVHGNVWEWVWDVWGWLPEEPAIDPLGPAEGTDSARVLRGGAYDSAATGSGRLGVRSASREQGLPHWRRPNVGLRLARTAD